MKNEHGVSSNIPTFAYFLTKKSNHNESLKRKSLTQKAWGQVLTCDINIQKNSESMGSESMGSSLDMRHQHTKASVQALTPMIF